MESYQGTHVYRKLSIIRPSIRIISLQPGSSSESIKVKLTHVFIDEDPVYDALSYVWGDASKTIDITVDNNEHFPVTTNLYSALHCLRSEIESLEIWIDAISINQKDIEERSSQVSLMSKIYSRAKTVRTFLDHDIDARGAAFLQLMELEENGGEIVLTSGSIFWHEIQNVIEDLYWGRAWVQQELALAKDAIIHAKRTPFSIKKLYWLRDAFHKSLSPRDLFSPHSEWAELVLALYRVQKGLHHTLLHTLFLSFGKTSTDHRDKVYAAFGLIQDFEPEKFKVDYSLSIIEVYLNIVSYMIENQNSVDFLITVPMTAFQQNKNTLAQSKLSTLNLGLNVEPTLTKLDSGALVQGYRTGLYAQVTTDLDPDFPSWLPDWRLSPNWSLTSSRSKWLDGADYSESADFKPVLSIDKRLLQVHEIRLCVFEHVENHLLENVPSPHIEGTESFHEYCAPFFKKTSELECRIDRL